MRAHVHATVAVRHTIRYQRNQSPQTGAAAQPLNEAWLQAAAQKGAGALWGGFAGGSGGAPSKHAPWKNTRCSSRNFSITSLEWKVISRDTAAH